MNCEICKELRPKQNKKFCSRKCAGKYLSKLFRGKGKSPYIQIRINGKRMYLHRYIWEKANGRKLHDGEIVHHINEDKSDNSPENLEVLSGRAAHLHKHDYFRKREIYQANKWKEDLTPEEIKECEEMPF